MPGETNIPQELPPTQADVATRRALEEKLAQFEELQARREREREAEIRADERGRIAMELRSVAVDPKTLDDWLTAHDGAMSRSQRYVAERVLRAVAGWVGSRLGGYPGGDDEST